AAPTPSDPETASLCGTAGSCNERTYERLISRRRAQAHPCPGHGREGGAQVRRLEQGPVLLGDDLGRGTVEDDESVPHDHDAIERFGHETHVVANCDYRPISAREVVNDLLDRLDAAGVLAGRR